MYDASLSSMTASLVEQLLTGVAYTGLAPRPMHVGGDVEVWGGTVSTIDHIALVQ